MARKWISAWQYHRHPSSHIYIYGKLTWSCGYVQSFPWPLCRYLVSMGRTGVECRHHLRCRIPLWHRWYFVGQNCQCFHYCNLLETLLPFSWRIEVTHIPLLEWSNTLLPDILPFIRNSIMDNKPLTLPSGRQLLGMAAICGMQRKRVCIVQFCAFVHVCLGCKRMYKQVQIKKG